jgi:hypothetical protein
MPSAFTPDTDTVRAGLGRGEATPQRLAAGARS